MARRDRLASGRRALCTVVLAVAGITTMAETRTWADTLLVPSLMVSERYDTNVYFITSGQNLTDYVTTISPSLLVEHKGRIIEGSVTTTVMGEIYALNPGLNYIAPNASLNLSLDQIVGRLDRRAKLRISDSFSYTPRPPAFLAPGDAGGAVPAEFVRGIQTIRANSITNVGTVAGSYGLTPASSLLASYTHWYMRFGSTFLPQGTTAQAATGVQDPFFTTQMQILTVGPEVKVTPRDVFTASFQRMQMEFKTGNESFGFETKGGLVGWKRGLTQQWTVAGSLGLSILTPGNSLQYLGNASLEWKHKQTTATLSYSRTVFPSFFIAAAPLISDNIGVSGSQKLSASLTATASANYALNQTISGPVAVKFESWTMNIGLSYNISRTLIASATYSHSEFSYVLSEQDFAFDQDVLRVTLRKEWR